MIPQELRFAIRTLVRSPGFTLTSIALLALAIGANTAMFSVLNAVLLRPLPYRAPEQLAMLWSESPAQNIREGRTAYRSFEEWRSRSKSFAGMAAFDPVSATLTSDAEAAQISVARVTPNFFSLLGVQPRHGRSFSAEEAQQRQRLVLISHGSWQKRFGGSLEAIGASLVLDGVPHQITGVLPAAFQFAPLSADVWQAHTMFPDWERRRAASGVGSWFVLGRLGPDVTFEQAQEEMNALARHLDAQGEGTGRDHGISVIPLAMHVTGARARLALWLLAGAVLCVLLIAATNVAGLVLARGAGRMREIAVRAALGASRGRIIRQLLVESLSLSLVSGAAGVFVAQIVMGVILAVKPGGLARLNEVALDMRALACAFVLCLLTGMLAGLAPSIALVRRNLSPAVHEGGRAIAGGMAAQKVRRLLVVTQFALAILLLAGAGLLVRSLWSIEDVDPGFRPDRVLSAQLSTPVSMANAQRTSFYDRLLEEIGSLPGVESAGIISELFVSGNPERVVAAEGDGRVSFERLRFRSDEASPGFFAAAGAPLLRGRFFTNEDGRGLPQVAIINDAMASRLWPGRDAVGRRFRLGAEESGVSWFTVVGVVGDMHRQGLETTPLPQMFEPLAQNPPRLATLLVRTFTRDPLEMIGTVQAAARRVEKHAPVYGVTSLESRLERFLTERRFQTLVLTSFSVVAVVMAAIGIYGLIRYSIATRTHEIGIRMAVGAQAGDVFRMVIGEGLKLSLAGLALGLVGALWMGRVVSSLLFGVTARDPVTFATVSLLLTAVATAACFFPARRAMKVEPIVALRQE